MIRSLRKFCFKPENFKDKSILLAAVFVASAIFFNAGTVQAANRAFNDTRIGCDGNFSTAACWDTVPIAGDVLRIDGTCTFDNAASNLAYGNLEVSRNRAGSIIQWPVGGTNTLNIATVVKGSAGAGTINMTNGGTLQIRTSWTSTNTTFVSGTGTMHWNVTGGNSTLPSAIPTYNNLMVTVTGRTATLGIVTTVNGNLLIVGGTLASGNFNLTVNGNFTNNAAFTRGTATVTFGGSANQSIGGTTVTAFNNLTINKTGGTATLTNNVTAASNLTITAGTFDLSSFTADRTAAGGTLTVSNGAILRIGGTNTFPANYSTDALGTTSTVEYYGSTQTVGAQAYGNLILSGSGTKSVPAGTSVAGNLSIAPTGNATAGIAAGQNVGVGILTLGGLGRASGTWGSTISGAANQDNAYFNATTGIITVTTDTRMAQAALTAIATPSTITYGTTSTLSSSGGSGGGAVTFSAGASTGCSAIGNMLSVTNAGGTCSVTATKAGDTIYLSANSAALPVTLTPKNITITANAASKVYGAADPTFTYTSSDASATFSGALSRVAGESAGVYAMTIGSLAVVGSNYVISTFVPADFTISSAPTAALALNHPGNMNTGARLGYTVSRQDQYGNPTSASSTIAYLTSSSTSATKAFYNAASGGNQVSFVTIQPGSTSTQFWYYDTVPGAYTITAYDNPAGPDGPTGLADATDSLNVLAGAVKFIFANVPATATAGDTVTFNVYAVDSFSTIDNSFNQDVTVNKTGSASGAPTGGGLVTIINGIGTSTVSDTLAENVSLALQDTQSTGLNVSSTASILFNPGPITKFALNHPGNMNTGTRLGYTVSRKDQYNNPASSGNTVVYLTSNSTSATKAFYNSASGGSQIASTTIQSGSTSTQFWYYDSVAGTYAVTTYDNPAGPDGVAGIADAADNFSVVVGAVKFIFGNVPAAATAGDTITFNVYAVDSFNAVDPSFNQDVTVTKTGSASGGGLVDIVNGIATTTIADFTAESISLGLQDTQLTGLGAIDTKSIVFAAQPSAPSAPLGGAASEVIGVPMKPNPWVDMTFSGYVYPGAAISLIRKDQGLLQGPVLETVGSANDGTFLLKVNKVIRLTGQTYILVFADKNGQVSQTRAYNIPAGRETFGDENTIIAPSVGFSGDSVITKGKSIVIQGYATPKATVKIFVDGNDAGLIVVNNASGQYRYSLSTDNLDEGRHSVQARQTVNGVQSDGSNQQSFTVSTLANPKLDLNGDGVVDIKDISIYLSYLKNLGADLGNLHTIDKNLIRVLDLNGDGALNVQDLSILLGRMR